MFKSRIDGDFFFLGGWRYQTGKIETVLPWLVIVIGDNESCIYKVGVAWTKAMNKESMGAWIHPKLIDREYELVAVVFTDVQKVI